MPPDGFHHFIECHLKKVFSIVVFARTGFDSWEAKGPCFYKILKMWSLCLMNALMERVKVIHGVCTRCHLMVFTTSQNDT
jgi:hypothetical protein